MPETALPPGPRGMLRNAGLFSQIQRDFISLATRLQQQYGDIVYYPLGPLKIFQFTHPEQIHEVLVKKNDAFTKAHRFRDVLKRWNGNGLVLNEGKPWTRQRRLVQPAFQPKRVASYGELFVRNTQKLFEPHRGQQFDIAGVLHRLTFLNVAEALFGEDVTNVADEFIAVVAVLQEAAIADLTAAWVSPMWWPTPSRARLRKAVRWLNQFVRGIIQKRRASGEDRGDLLSMLLLAVDEDGGTGQMTDEQVRDEAVGLLGGGNETTATALTWTVYLLATNEAVQEAVHAEIDRVTAGAMPSAEHVPLLGLTTAAMKEAMRIYPPAYILTRQVAEEVEIGGCLLPRGAQVHLPLILVQRDERWFDRAMEFVPQRFFDDGEKQFARGAYIPFGAGPRACIGRGFALFEGALVLATILQHFHLRRSEQDEPEQEAQFSLHPKGGLQLTLEPR